jgi:hypothetical protein
VGMVLDFRIGAKSARPGMTGLHKQKGRHKCRPSLGREVS